jgi:hypothetical protein
MGAWFLTVGLVITSGIRHLRSKRCKCNSRLLAQDSIELGDRDTGMSSFSD